VGPFPEVAQTNWRTLMMAGCNLMFSQFCNYCIYKAPKRIHFIFTSYPLDGKPARGSSPTSGIRVAAKVKTFVLDTNVLLHDPQSIYKFEDNNLAIPVEVL